MCSSALDAVTIVTCGARGVGREVAHELGRRGCAIVVVYLDDQRGVERVVGAILDAGGTAVAVRADLADDLDVERLFTETVALFGCADVVVHTTAGGLTVLCRHAARHLGRGAVIVSVGPAEDLAPDVAAELRARGIAVEIVVPAPHAAGSDGVVARLLTLLERRVA